MNKKTQIGAHNINKTNPIERKKTNINVRIGIFFDGTNNHRLQVLIGKNYRLKKLHDKIIELDTIIKKNKNKNYTEYIIESAEYKKNEISKRIDDLQKEILYSQNFNRENIFENSIDKLKKLSTNYHNTKIYDTESHISSIIENKKNKIIQDNINRLSDLQNNNTVNNINKNYEGLLQHKNENLWNNEIQDIQANDFTNIAILETHYNCDSSDKKENTRCFKIYIEGSGTDEDVYEGENLEGLAFGQGTTGVIQKVKDIINRITHLLSHYNNSNCLGIDLHLEIFGFSRGATSARVLTHVLSGTNKESVNKLMQKSKITLNDYVTVNIKFDFMGIYDTVSSVGVKTENKGIFNHLTGFVDHIVAGTTSSSDHSKNVKDLGLNSLSKISKVVHICAADEYRENFALIDITSARNNGTEIFIPGAHADIGGGYSDRRYNVFINKKIDKYIHMANKTITFECKIKLDNNSNPVSIDTNSLNSLGWILDYNNTQDEYAPTISETENSIEFTYHPKKGYNTIGLHMMHDLANKHRKEMFKNIDSHYTIPGCLIELYNSLLENYKSLNKKENIEKIAKWGDIKSYQNLRRHFLHFSADSRPPKKRGVSFPVIVVNGPNYKEWIWERHIEQG